MTIELSGQLNQSRRAARVAIRSSNPTKGLFLQRRVGGHNLPLALQG